MLSIVILYCDRDWQFIEKLISSINNKLKICHQIICIDNRQNTHEIINFQNAEVHGLGYNMYQLAARKYAMQFVKGNYVWFIDADDDIYEVDSSFSKLLENNYDIIEINYKNSDNLVGQYFIEEEFTKDSLCYEEMFKKMQGMLWNKWINYNILKKVFLLIPDNVKVISSEDIVINFFILKYAKSFKHINNIFYFYNSSHSYADEKILTSIDNLKHILYGHNTANNLILNNFTNEEKKSLNLEFFFKCDSIFFLKKILYCKDIILQKKAIKILSAYFDKDSLKNSLDTDLFYTYIESKREIVKDQIDQLKKAFNL